MKVGFFRVEKLLKAPQKKIKNKINIALQSLFLDNMTYLALTIDELIQYKYCNRWEL